MDNDSVRRHPATSEIKSELAVARLIVQHSFGTREHNANLQYFRKDGSVMKSIKLFNNHEFDNQQKNSLPHFRMTLSRNYSAAAIHEKSSRLVIKSQELICTSNIH